MRLRDLDQYLRPLRRRVSALFSRGAWIWTYDGGGLRQGQVSLLANEVRDKLEHIEPYGFTSSPQVGAEAFVVSLGGTRDHSVIIVAADRRFRLRTLEAGEVALYDDQGSSIVLKRGGRIEVRAAAGVDVVGDVRVQGSLEVTGDLADGTGSLQDLRDIYNLHEHQEHGTGGGITGPPLTQA